MILVMIATCGLRCNGISPSNCQLDSSRTTQLSGSMRGSVSSAERRRLPATTSGQPCSRTMAASSNVVVVLPLVPVTPMIFRLGHSAKKSVISMTTGTPAAAATCKYGEWRGTAGLRTTRSADRKSSSRCCPQHVGDREVGQGVQRSGQLLGGSEIGHGNVRAALGQKSGHAYAAAVSTPSPITSARRPRYSTVLPPCADRSSLGLHGRRHAQSAFQILLG